MFVYICGVVVFFGKHTPWSHGDLSFTSRVHGTLSFTSVLTRYLPVNSVVYGYLNILHSWFMLVTTRVCMSSDLRSIHSWDIEAKYF